MSRQEQHPARARPKLDPGAGDLRPIFGGAAMVAAIQRIREPLHLVREAPGGRLGLLAAGGTESDGTPREPDAALPFQRVGTLPALYPEWLGDRGFVEEHGLRFPYVGGAMANGISTPAMVVALARAGMLGFFGAGGLDPAEVRRGLLEIRGSLGSDGPGAPSWGSNLIYSPHDPALEAALVEIYLQPDTAVQRVSASAYMKLTLPVVRYACTGLRVDAAGRIRRRNHLFAKISRTEVARLFISPPPSELLQALVAANQLTEEEANLAGCLPLAEEITVEADSGGHTDNRPLTALFPAIQSLRDQVARRQQYPRPIRLGAAGGLGTPGSVAAAFGMGAAYVLTGSVNQAAVESGLSAAGKAMLAEAGVADVVMAPSPDMFELGVKVQVLRRGSLFAARAARLYELYCSHPTLEAIPADLRQRLEQDLFRAPLEQIWQETRAYFARRNPEEVDRAEGDPKRRMALVFRWYLGRASRWAIEGEPTRQLDYQIWCGPAIGAFNAWTAGSFLARPEKRTVDQISRNLLEGAAVVARAQQLRCCGVPVPAAAFVFRPRPLA